jgi:hypothetical protein
MGLQMDLYNELRVLLQKFNSSGASKWACSFHGPPNSMSKPPFLEGLQSPPPPLKQKCRSHNHVILSLPLNLIFPPPHPSSPLELPPVRLAMPPPRARTLIHVGHPTSHRSHRAQSSRAMLVVPWRVPCSLLAPTLPDMVEVVPRARLAGHCARISLSRSPAIETVALGAHCAQILPLCLLSCTKLTPIRRPCRLTTPRPRS